MMTYTAPDGHIIESVPLPNEVTYISTCSRADFGNGFYYSYETMGAPTILGVQGIHVNRTVNEEVMIIVIKEFSEQELIDLKSISPES